MYFKLGKYISVLSINFILHPLHSVILFVQHSWQC